MSRQAYLCRARSRCFLFFWTIVLGFADVSSPSLMGYGQLKCGHFADLQRFSFVFGFSLSESKG